MGEPEIFVLRIWRQLASGFRASVRRVDEEEPRLFSRPDDLTRFLTTPPQASALPGAGPEAAAPSNHVPVSR